MSQHNTTQWSIISKYRTELMGLATIFVILTHGNFANFFDYPKNLDFVLKIFSFGNCGVDIFLLLSGIGLYYAMTKCKNIIQFYSKRIKRLLIPIFFIILPGYILFDCTLNLVSKGNFFAFLLQFWYIPFTFCMYFIYPVIFFILNCKKTFLSNIYFFILITFSIMISVATQKINYATYLRFCLAIDRLPVFFVGCYLGKFVYNKKSLSIKKCLIFNASVFLLLFCLYTFLIDNMGTMYVQLRYYSYIFLSICIVLIFCYTKETIKNKSKFFTFMGKLSLEIYILHVLFLVDFYIVSTFGKNHRLFLFYYGLIIPLSIIFAMIFSKLYNLCTKYARTCVCV